MRLRPQVLTDAEQALAATIARQSAAQAAMEAAERDLVERRDIATRSVNDAAVDEFAAWLPSGKRVLDAAERRLARDATAAAAARAALRFAEAALAGDDAG